MDVKVDGNLLKKTIHSLNHGNCLLLSQHHTPPGYYLPHDENAVHLYPISEVLDTIYNTMGLIGVLARLSRCPGLSKKSLFLLCADSTLLDPLHCV